MGLTNLGEPNLPIIVRSNFDIIESPKKLPSGKWLNLVKDEYAANDNNNNKRINLLATAVFGG